MSEVEGVSKVEGVKGGRGQRWKGSKVEGLGSVCLETGACRQNSVLSVLVKPIT